MKRLMLFICALCIVSSAFAQRYDYDDIYFNPKKDIQKVTDKRVQTKDNKVKSDADTQLSSFDSEISYTARINMFHRADSDTIQGRLAHIADPNYTTNVFVLSDGQYVVDVDGNNIEISENYNYPYMDWSSYYWNRPYYSSSYYWNRSLYGWYGNYGWSVGFYDPYFYGFYNSWYDPFYTPYWGYSNCYYDPYWGHYHHHHHHGYYPHYGNGSHHSKPDWSDYNRGNENERRNINSSSRIAANVAASNRVATTSTPSSVRRTSDRSVSTSTVRGASTSTNRTTTATSTNSQRRKTSTSALPARPTTTREATPITSTARATSTVKSSSSTTVRHSTSTVRSSSSTTRSTSTYRPSSSSTRSSGGFSGGSSSGGRSSGSSSSSTRRR